MATAEARRLLEALIPDRNATQKHVTWNAAEPRRLGQERYNNLTFGAVACSCSSAPSAPWTP